jgi:hypothetical protein
MPLKSAPTDLHVHLTTQFTIQDALAAAMTRGLRFGIVEHPEPNWGLKDDADLQAYIDSLRPHPVFIGLQPVYRGWNQSFSPGVLSQVDYILMDPQTVPQPDGTFLHIWEFNTFVPDTEVFMRQYMDHALGILENEPIDIFAWPLFLPVCIARDYYTLWTVERMQQIISAAKAHNVAIEINEMAHVPDENFIRMAKVQGLKFTFGTDSRTQAGAGRLIYCQEVARLCGLTAEDFYIPVKKT